MLRHIVRRSLKDLADAPHFKALVASCRQLVFGMQAFEVAMRTAGLQASCDVVLYSI